MWGGRGAQNDLGTPPSTMGILVSLGCRRAEDWGLGMGWLVCIINDFTGRRKPLGPKPKSVNFSRKANQTPPSPSALDSELNTSSGCQHPPLCLGRAVSPLLPSGLVGQSLECSSAELSGVVGASAIGLSSLWLLVSWLSSFFPHLLPSYFSGSPTQTQDLRILLELIPG